MGLEHLCTLSITLLRANEIDVCIELMQASSRSEIIVSIDSLEDFVSHMCSSRVGLSSHAQLTLQRYVPVKTSMPVPGAVDDDYVRPSPIVDQPKMTPLHVFALDGSIGPTKSKASAKSKASRGETLKVAEAWKGSSSGKTSVSSAQQTPFLPRRSLGSCAKRLFLLLENPGCSILGRLICGLIITAIFASSVAFVMESMPRFRYRKQECHQLRAMKLPPTIEACEPIPDDRFFIVEACCTVIFTVDYILRLLTVHASDLPGSNGITRTLLYAVSALNIVDLAAIIPFYVDVIFGSGQSFIMRIIRLVRIMRLIKIAKHTRGAGIILRVFELSGEPLLILVVFNVIVVIVFAALMHYAEGQRFSVDEKFRTLENPAGVFVRMDQSLQEDEVSPFRSIPYAIWWVCVTMTTVGYGDYSPTTILGKLIAISCFYVGMVFLALPITVLSSNFQIVLDSLKESGGSESTDSDSEERLENADSIVPHESSVKTSPQASVFGQNVESTNYTFDTDEEQFRCLPAWKGWRRTLFLLLEDESSSGLAKSISFLMMVAILISTVSIVLESMSYFNEIPAACDLSRPSVNECTPQPKMMFGVLEIVCVSLFTLDYLARITVVHTALPRECGVSVKHECTPLSLTWIYVRQPMNVIDLAAILPFYLQTVMGLDAAGFGVLRVLRLIRVFRILKTPKLRYGAKMLVAVIRDCAPGVMGIFLGMLLLCTFFASCVFFAEGTTYSVDPQFLADYPDGVYVRPTVDGYGVMPSTFTSILYCFWWFFVTACTVGYGDDYPTTSLGKSIGIIVFLIGIMMLAFVMTVVGSAFVIHYKAFVEAVKMSDRRRNKSASIGS
eukprot:TRINITY_DN26913_c0_g1_i1.p1 TRINITY_DN26913_c0_g1~~TRINITY_DN26913_c0_g1_i1.p1  ORF type:complete len:841 (-),score=75.29 TRINITY_DN26913_c0_g1_i1:205-2727(-)